MKRTTPGESLRRLCRALLMPLLLLVAHQGAFLHELSHFRPVQVEDEDHEHEAGGPCTLCLGFASVECAAGFSAAVAPLLPGLRFALLAVAPIVMRAATVPAQRNRGPPFSG